MRIVFSQKMKRFSIALVLVLVFASCSSYDKVQKSNDVEKKLQMGKNFYLEKKYTKSIALFESVVSSFRGTPQAEELLFLLSCSYMQTKDYMAASEYFDTYMRNFPRGKFAEESHYLIARCYYLDSPDVRLDQTATENAIYAFSEYIELYPAGSHVDDSFKYITEMENKLAYKDYLAAKLYYDLGLYGGNNYRACVVTAENMLKEYPDCQYREEAIFLILKSKYKEAILSVEDKRYDRFSEVVDEYYRYANEFPNGKFIKDANKIMKEARKTVGTNSEG